MRGYFCLIAFLSVILGCAGASTGDDVIELSYALTSAPKWTTLGSLPAARFAAGPEGAAFEPLGELGVAAAAAVAVAPTGALLMLRAARGGVEIGTASVPACSVFEAGGRLDVVLFLGVGGAPRALQVRPALSAGWRGCGSSRKMPASSTAVAGLALRTSRALAEVVEPLPAVLPGRGAPYPGQREVGEQEAALTAPGLPEEEKKELQRKLAAEERRKAEEAKPWWQRYWHIILPIAIVVVIQVAQGGEKVEEVAQRAASDTPALAR